VDHPGRPDPRGAQSHEWRLRDHILRTDRPLIAGILNVTPDSFSDGGRYQDPEVAIGRAHELVDSGADLLDIGAESTRPGAEPVDAEEEWRRLEPVLTGLSALAMPLSVDTTKLEVARRALEVGAAVINDVSGLREDPRLAELAAESGAGLVLMHMRGTPRTMQTDTRYDDLIGDVRRFLERALDRAVQAGCHPEQVVLDPGIGFGKSTEGNLELLARVDAFAALGRPILVGPSRKTFIGQLLNLPSDERVEGTIGACVMALDRGAHIFRVHDVREVRRAMEIAFRIREAASSAIGSDADTAMVAAGQPERPRA
jgi:dihydropteroate synthase